MFRPTIVIIDSGVKKDHVKLARDHVNEINPFETYNNVENYGHGTAIYGIIRRCIDIADIINIKIPNIENGITDKELIDILSYVSNNIDVNIINLSLGISAVQSRKELKNICDELMQKGVIIVAAFDNSGCISYPAAFENVIGVISGTCCKKIDDFEYIEDTVVNIGAKGNIQRVLWNNPEYITIGGNSFACAHTTVQVAKFMCNGYMTLDKILEQFKMSAIKKYTFNANIEQVHYKYHINKAVLFPFNKEMHSLIKYFYLLPFDITNIYDSKYSAHVGASTTLLMKDERAKPFIISDISNIEWDDFDTLIMGHVEELSNLIMNTSLIKYILKTAIDYNKNIYMFDDYDYNDSYIAEYSKLFVPKITANNLPPYRFGMLYRITKPVLGILGTSSKQGKFTLQLNIRERLLEIGYNVGQVGTEPSALLYGMDYVYPMGYNSSVYIKDYDTIRYLNYIINRLCVNEKDIIIVGSQSGTVTYDIGNIMQFNISQYNFLLGTQPDAVILCINPYDEIDLIRRTIVFIEASVNCKVIALVVFPMDLKNDWKGIYGAKETLAESKYLYLKSLLYSEFLMPIYNLGSSDDMTNLINDIIVFFSN